MTKRTYHEHRRQSKPLRRKPSPLPAHVEQTLRGIKRLRAFLDRREVKRVIPPSQAAILAGALDRWWRFGLLGAGFIHPGVDEISNWAQCSRRQAQRAFVFWENQGVFEVVSDRSGGRGRATCFRINVARLCQVLVECGSNPTKNILSEIRNTEEFVALTRQKGRHERVTSGEPPAGVSGAEYQADDRSQKGDIKGDAMSPRKRRALPFHDSNRSKCGAVEPDETTAQDHHANVGTSGDGRTVAMNAEHEAEPSLSKSRSEPPSATVEGPAPNVLIFPAGRRVASRAPVSVGGPSGAARAVAAEVREPERRPDLVAEDPLPAVDWRRQIAAQEASEPVSDADWEAWRAACHGAEVAREVFRAHREDPPDLFELWA
ncbi:hypothetical protein ACFFKB_24270 [Mameliella alba]